LPPHRLRTFKRSRDPGFAAKLTDIVGLYVDPPAHAVVLAIDEKSPDPSPRPEPAGIAGQARALLEHDARLQASRTATLFAALSVLDGTVIGRCMQRATVMSNSFVFQCRRAPRRGRQADPCRPRQLRHPKHPKVLASMARYPRWTSHFTPTLSLLAQRRRGQSGMTRLWELSHYWMWGACYAFASSHSFLARVAGADRPGVELCHVLRLCLGRGSNRRLVRSALLKLTEESRFSILRVTKS